MKFFCVKTRIFAAKVYFLLGDAKLFHRFNSSENISNYSAVGARRIVKPQIRLELH